MSLHPLDSNDEVRECFGCSDCTNGASSIGSRCQGTGELGNPDAEKVIEVHWTNGGLFPQTRGWHWRRVGAGWSDRDPCDAESEALAAARKALK